MAKFDVHRLEDGILVVDCQADLLADLDTRFVVPLVEEAEAWSKLERLNPRIIFAGKPYRVMPQDAANPFRSELGAPIGSVAEHDLTIGNALDMLISGF